MTVVEHHSTGELQELFRHEKDARLAKRIWMVWQARVGLTELQITASIGLARRTVQTWVQRYNEKGLAGLRDRPGRGRKPILSPEEQQAVAQRLEAGPQGVALDVLPGCVTVSIRSSPPPRPTASRRESRGRTK